MRIEAQGVTVHANGTTLLHRLDLQLEPGHLVGVIGPNGAGKTTLLRLLAHLRPPDAGQVLYDGATAAQLGPTTLARHLAYLAQGTTVHWPLTVEHLVGLGRLPYRRLWRQDDHRRCPRRDGGAAGDRDRGAAAPHPGDAVWR